MVYISIDTSKAAKGSLSLTHNLGITVLARFVRNSLDRLFRPYIDNPTTHYRNPAMEYFIQGSDRGGRNSKRAKATRKRRKTSKALKHAQSPSHSPSSQPVTRESRKAKPKRGSKRNKGSHATPSKRQKRRQGERQGESRGQDPLPNLPGTSGKDKDKGQDEDDNNAAQANVPGISHRHLASTPNRGAHPSSPPHRASSSLPAAFSTPRPVSASSPPPVAPPPVGSMTASSPPPVGSMTGSLVLGSTVRGVLSSSSKRIRKRRRRSRGSPEEDTPHTPLTPHASSTSHIIRDQPSEQTFEFGNDEDSDSDNHLRHEYTESNGDADGAHGKGGEKKEKKTTKKGKKKGKRKRPQSGTRKCLRAELEQNKELEGARQREKKEEKKERAKQARAERMAKRNLRQVVSTVEGEEGEEEEKEEGEDSDDLQFDNSDNANEEKERKGSNDRALDAVDVDTGPGDEENDKDPSNDIERVHDHGHAGDNDKDGVHGNEKENDNTHNSQLTGTHSQAESDDQHQHHDQHKHKHQYPQAQTQPQLYGRQAMPSSCPSKTLTHAKGGSGKEAREEREGNRKERDEREEKGGRGGGNGDNGNGNGNIHDNDDRDDRRSHDNVRIDASNIMDTDAGSKILSLSPNKGGEERRENIRRNVKKENQGDGYAKIKRTITKPNTEANEAEKRREGTHMTDSTIGVDSEIIHEYGSISAGDTSRATVQATTQRQGQCSSAMKKEGETCIEQEESSDSDTVAEEDFYRQRLERQKKEREEEITRSSRSNSNLNHNGTEHARVFVSTSVPSSDFTRVIGETEDITDDNIYSVGIDDHGRRKNSEDREDSEESEESEESEDDAEYEIGVDDSFEWNAKVEKRHWRELRLVEAIMQDQHTLMQACLEGGNLSGNGNGDTRTTFRSEARNSKRSHRSASNRALNKHKHAQVSPLCPARSVASLRLPITLLLQKIHRKQRLEPVLRKRRRERRKERKVLARNMLELRHRVTSQKYGGKEGKYSVELEDDSRDEAHDALLSVINDYRADIVDPAHSAERECKSAEESEGGLLHLCAMFNARRCAKVTQASFFSLFAVIVNMLPVLFCV